MAPVNIKYVVSFTSQDPKHPVENLLLEEGCPLRPWLCCPRDRSRQLKAELQLEQATRIGYVDVGNCGSAFLQIDVGRSSWAPGQNYLTLLPCTALMTPSEAKGGQNRCGVRMFKKGDFLAPALAEKWDRVRLTCSQPFNRQAQFGLTFLRIRTPLDAEEAQAAPASSPGKGPAEPPSNPWLSNAAICRTFFPEEPAVSEEEVALRSRLQQLDPSSSPGGTPSPCLSRTARMVLKAASASSSSAPRKRVFPLLLDSSPLGAKSGEEKRSSPQAVQKNLGLRSEQESAGRRDRRKTSRRRGSGCNNGGRPRNVSQRKGGAQDRKRNRLNVERRENEEGGVNRPEDGAVASDTCPICAGRFPAEALPAHASRCGEEEDLAPSPSSSSSSSSSSSWEEAWVQCPICQLPFRASEIESHASGCGDQAQPSGSSPPWLWAE
ncbi:protein XNDC1N [Anolis carolinensis]|uniref:protein XNDC1N n=1 Tax=Anolis carolinensis TaxID=28377 RepID=UPI002F2B1CD7